MSGSRVRERLAPETAAPTEDVAQAVLYLSSDRARFVAGAARR